MQKFDKLTPSVSKLSTQVWDSTITAFIFLDTYTHALNDLHFPSFRWKCRLL